MKDFLKALFWGMIFWISLLPIMDKAITISPLFK